MLTKSADVSTTLFADVNHVNMKIHRFLHKTMEYSHILDWAMISPTSCWELIALCPSLSFLIMTIFPFSAGLDGERVLELLLPKH